MARLVQLCTAVGLATCATLLLSQNHAILLFTTSPEVIASFHTAFALVMAFLPLDAVMIAVDGTLLGLQKHAFVARSSVIGSVMCLVALYFSQQVAPSLLTVWLSLKALTFCRLSLGGYMLLGPDSPLNQKPAAKIHVHVEDGSASHVEEVAVIQSAELKEHVQQQQQEAAAAAKKDN